MPPAVWAGLTVWQGAGPRPRAGPATFARAARPGFAPRGEGADYLPHMYSDANFVIIDDVRTLPQKLPQLYRRLTT